MKKLFCSLLLFALTLNAAELTGKWSGGFEITNSEGETKSDTAYMDLKEKDGVVTGTAGPASDKQWPIKNGKIDGQKLTFDVDADDGHLVFELTFDGEGVRGTCIGTGSGGEKMSAKLNLKRAS